MLYLLVMLLPYDMLTEEVSSLKKLLVLICLFFLLFSISASSQTQIIQLSEERDPGSRIFINWTELIVVWDTEVVTSIPDSNPVDDDILQEFYAVVEDGWKRFSFQRVKRGEYAVRYSGDGQLFSEPAVVRCILPVVLRHVD